MRAKKIYCVVAYDIRKSKRRQQVVKLLTPFGRRVNKSVFECLFSDAQLARLRLDLQNIIVKKEDQVAIYPICVNCYARSVYIPAIRNDFSAVHVFD